MKNEEHIIYSNGEYRVTVENKSFFVLHISRTKNNNDYPYICADSAIAHCNHLAYSTPTRQELWDEISRLKLIINEQDELLIRYTQIAAKNLHKEGK